MLLFPVTIFLSAFLLFLLQLVMARQILPWFGGSAGVWATSMVFFQVLLLAGYAYADWLVRRFNSRWQMVVHGLLLVVSLALMPVIPGAGWKPSGAEDPALRILVLLGAVAGLPYFMLSTTSPLLQAWFARACPGKSPYGLFAMSNVASLAALAGYPLVIEPWLGTVVQAKAWSCFYAGFVILCGGAAWCGMKGTAVPAKSVTNGTPPLTPGTGTQLLWCALAALGSMLSLAVTNHLTQDVASVPLLWVLPLAVYLLTFILCFDGRGWYRRGMFLVLAGVTLAVVSWWLAQHLYRPGVPVQIGIYLAGLFVLCMFCHGELHRLRPAPEHLTRFYLMIALGGALGALLVGSVAPLVFSEVLEFPLALCALAVLWFWQACGKGSLRRSAAACVVLLTAGALVYMMTMSSHSVKLSARNFYGVLKVLEKDPGNADNFNRTLIHGGTVHGEQFPKGRFARTPTTYYTVKSGIGRTLIRLGMKNVRVGIIGLGAGTIAAYGRPGDIYRFYEINPTVVEIAGRDFTFLRNSDAKIEIAQGDARLNLEREPSNQFIVLAVDAFSGDSIPMHLLTSEAMDLYLKHLAPEGVMAFHVTNKSLDLAPMVQLLAEKHGLQSACIAESTADNLYYPSVWMLLTRSRGFLEVDIIRAASSPVPPRPRWTPWTDDFHNLIQVLK